MSKENNLTDFLTDVADAIREKKGTTDKINPQDFSDEIKGIKTSSSIWTGHVDVEGLKAIGWDDEDIAYFQEHGVNWMEEDDEYYKVSDDNKALYGVLTADNIQEYKDRVVWLPKIDFSGVVNGTDLLSGLSNMLGMPSIDTSNIINMKNFLMGCSRLLCVPILDISNVENMDQFVHKCSSLIYMPPLDTKKVTNFNGVFATCLSLIVAPILDYTNARVYNYMFNDANVEYIPHVDMKGINASYFIANNKRLRYAGIKNINCYITIGNDFISKSSILYIINNEASTKQNIISLTKPAYARLSTDPDIVAALENHPLVSLASA